MNYLKGFCIFIFGLFVSCGEVEREEKYLREIKRAKGAIATANFEKAIAILEEYKSLNQTTDEIDSLILTSKKLIPFRDSSIIAKKEFDDSLVYAKNRIDYIERIYKIVNSNLCNNKSSWKSLVEIEEDLANIDLVLNSSLDGFEKHQGELIKCKTNIPIVLKRMRESFGHLFNESAWIENIEARILGGSSDQIVIIGPQFYDNKGKQDGYNELSDVLKKLNFIKVTFKGNRLDEGHSFKIE